MGFLYRAMRIRDVDIYNQRTAGVQICTPRFFSNIFATRENFKVRSNHAPEGHIPDVQTFSAWTYLFSITELPGKPRAPSMEKSQILCCSMQLPFAEHIIPTLLHIFDHADLIMTKSTSTDVGDDRFKMAAPNRNGNNLNGRRLRRDFKGYTHYSTTPNLDWRWDTCNGPYPSLRSVAWE